jgi:L-ribulose-5-phosphate 3-epimerase
MSGSYSPDRRELFTASAAAIGASTFAAQPKAPGGPRKKYPFKKSINLWAFPYPEKMTLEQCLKLAKDAGFHCAPSWLPGAW